MWKDYSVGFIRNNRASSISIMVAAFISSLFLSFLCSMFYNVWVYEVEKIVLEEGDWQGRLTGVTDAGDLLTIENFANVEKAVVNEALSGEQGIVADIYFHNVRTVYKDMPMIAKRLGLDEKAWIVLLNARNQTSHLYDDATAQEIYSQIESEFVSLFDKLIEQLKCG